MAVLLGRNTRKVEINTIRKHLSAVKGGRFAISCKPARIVSILLSDVVGDRLDTIASGPAYPDHSTVQDALDIIEKYKLKLEDAALLNESFADTFSIAMMHYKYPDLPSPDQTL